jgi:hypothetical protein
MRTRPLLVIPSALAFGALAIAPGLAATPKSVNCGTSQQTVLFWPHGHSAIGSVGFPKIKTPHLEVYTPGAGYPSSNFQLYADSKGGVDPSASCGHGARRNVAGPAAAKTIKAKRAVTCTGDATVVYDIKKSKSGVTVVGRTSAKALWRASLRKKGASKLTFNSKLCTVQASPK